MKILVTGAKGFVGKNLVSTLKVKGYISIFEYDIDVTPALLEQYTKECDFVFHLAGVNRPKHTDEFMEGNVGFTSVLLNNLKKNKNKAPILITSSIQAGLNNPYGQSKLGEEETVFNYSTETGVKVYVYRLPNVFGKWCKPNYNSVIATFCNNIANNLPIQVNDPNVLLSLVYIDDVVNEFINAMNGKASYNQLFCFVKEIYNIQLGEIVKLIESFKESREVISIPDMSDPFTKKLYSTYLSYLPVDQFKYPLQMNVDERGSFTEFIRTPDRGQVSINVSKPGITKGNHWHHTKNEKFLVVSGKGAIRFRKIDSQEIIEYIVSGDKFEVLDIPTGYTHNIENLGDTDMVTVMWANEKFDKANPDTYYLPV